MNNRINDEVIKMVMIIPMDIVENLNKDRLERDWLENVKKICNNISAATETNIKAFIPEKRKWKNGIIIQIEGKSENEIERAESKIMRADLYRKIEKIKIPLIHYTNYGYIKIKIFEVISDYSAWGKCNQIIIEKGKINEESGDFLINGSVHAIKEIKKELLLLFSRLEGKIIEDLDIDPENIVIYGGPYMNKIKKLLKTEKVIIEMPEYFFVSYIEGFKMIDDSLMIGYDVEISSENDRELDIKLKTIKKKPKIIGENLEILRLAKQKLSNEIKKNKWTKEKTTFYFHARKIELALTTKLKEITEICYENGIYMNINFNNLKGKVSSKVIINGRSIANIQKAKKEMLRLIYNYQIASVESNLYDMKSIEIIENFALSLGLRVWIVQKKINFMGEKNQLLKFFELLSQEITNQILPPCNEIIIYLETFGEDKEFVCGKKEGKLNKVMRTAKVNLEILEENEYSIIIKITGNTIESTINGFNMVEGELPSDISFFTTETHHKRIIGHGGKNIQKIMKNFGVYVKFLNSEEIKMKYGEDCSLFQPNVLVKTPTKNYDSLDRMKEVVLNLSSEEDLSIITKRYNLSQIYHIYIQEIVEKILENYLNHYNLEIYFPPNSWFSDEILIVGNSKEISNMEKILKNLIVEFSLVEIHYFEDSFKFINSSPIKDEILTISSKFNIQVYFPIDRKISRYEENYIKKIGILLYKLPSYLSKETISNDLIKTKTINNEKQFKNLINLSNNNTENILKSSNNLKILPKKNEINLIDECYNEILNLLKSKISAKIDTSNFFPKYKDYLINDKISSLHRYFVDDLFIFKREDNLSDFYECADSLIYDLSDENYYSQSLNIQDSKRINTTDIDYSFNSQNFLKPKDSNIENISKDDPNYNYLFSKKKTICTKISNFNDSQDFKLSIERKPNDRDRSRKKILAQLNFTNVIGSPVLYESEHISKKKNGYPDLYSLNETSNDALISLCNPWVLSNIWAKDNNVESLK